VFLRSSLVVRYISEYCTILCQFICIFWGADISAPLEAGVVQVRCSALRENHLSVAYLIYYSLKLSAWSAFGVRHSAHLMAVDDANAIIH